MFKLLNELKKDEELFDIGGISVLKVEEIEQNLEVIFPKDYKTFLIQFGLLSGYGVDILGCGKKGEASVVKITQKYRHFGLPKEYVVIRDVGEWIYCLDTITDRVISWDRSNKKPKRISDSFEEYLSGTILEAKENWDEL